MSRWEGDLWIDFLITGNVRDGATYGGWCPW